MTEPMLFEFATHVFQGKRFEGAIPVEVLPELAAYRELVVEVARALYFRENDGRQRVPKGFESGFQLVLREQIGHGSALVKLERATPEATVPRQLSLVPPSPEVDQFDRSRDLVNRTIEAAAKGESPPSEFPAHLLLLFNGFGRTLQDGERIELRLPSKSSGVRYDRALRKRLVLFKSSTYEDHVEVTGEVVQFDRQKMTFDLLVGDQRVPGRLDDLDEESVRTVYTAGAVGEDLKVRVTGVGARDESERLIRLVHVAQVQYAEDETLKERLDIEAPLSELGELADGWLDGTGAAFDPQALRWVAEALQAAESTGLPRPYLYPTPEGDVQAEWSFHGAEVSAEIGLASHEARLVGVHTKTGASKDKTVPLDTPRGLSDFVNFVNLYAP